MVKISFKEILKYSGSIVGLFAFIFYAGQEWNSYKNKNEQDAIYKHEQDSINKVLVAKSIEVNSKLTGVISIFNNDKIENKSEHRDFIKCFNILSEEKKGLRELIKIILDRKEEASKEQEITKPYNSNIIQIKPYNKSIDENLPIVLPTIKDTIINHGMTGVGCSVQENKELFELK